MNREKRVTSILNYIAGRKTPCRVTDLSNELMITKSSVSRIMMSLAELQWIEQLPSNEYILGEKAVEFSLAALSGIELRNVCLPILDELNTITRETVGLIMRVGTEDICIDQKESKNLVRHVLGLGFRHPLWTGASGKVILAHMDKDEAQDVLRGLEKSKDHISASGYKIDIRELKNELSNIRQAGYCISIGERTAVTTAIAAPIFERNKVIGSLIITGPLPRFDEKLATSFRDLIKNAAKRISARLGSTA